MSKSIKVVFDTQIYLRAAINPRSICGKLFAEWTDYYHLYIAEQIEVEILDVFTRSKVRAKFPQITDATLFRYREIINRAKRVKLQSADILSVSRDPKDDIFLACAKAAKADYLVSEDNDLLVLKHYENTRIVNALEFLHILESRSQD